MKMDKNKEKGIVEYIRNQTWFYQRYAQDPTVQGMLRTLGGTKIEDSTGNDIKDGLEGLNDIDGTAGQNG